ncbi:acetyl-CoA hydrolase/transferase C-terminal domain-containing protein [Streptomyces sp. NPDC051572]|uniref:acetyl-CoA hydrolase/transferase family protein n=1 Tax=unclassified Streptomyces TaxID=2593676 RepID=UPI00344ED428
MMVLPHRSARDALARIATGTHIVSAPGMGAPTTLLAEIGELAPGRGWTLSSGLLLGDYPFLPAVVDGDLTYRTWHVMAPVRGLVADGTVGYVPARASRLAGLLSRWEIGAALVRISPPDAHGYSSLGPSVGYGLAALRTAGTLIAEIDPAVPRTCGESCVHISVFDSLVESATALPHYSSAKPHPTSTRIAEHVLPLLPKEPTLQIGIGAVPETLVRSLKDADLGGVRFVGMATDEMVDLFEAGVLRRREVVPAPAVLSPEMMGTERLLSFGHGNPSIGMYPSSVSHDSGRLGDIERFVSVNTAIEVDLYGNVNSEVVAGRQISGPGGSLDYIDTAARSRGGLRIVALPSASSDGSVSRIVPSLGTVTIPRSMVDVVVTEQGVARLDGLTTRERARALLAIAHPDHQQALGEAVAL